MGSKAPGVTAVMFRTWPASSRPAKNAAPNLDNSVVQIASAIGGVLAAAFAVAFGIQRNDPAVDEKKLKLGSTLTPNAEFVTTVCLAVYFLVGAVTAVVTFTSSAQTPQEVKTPTTVFLGYVAAMFSGIVSGPGRTR